MKAEDITDEQYFAWIETPGNRPGVDCKYPTVGELWDACRRDLNIDGDWRIGMPHFFGVTIRWKQQLSKEAHHAANN